MDLRQLTRDLAVAPQIDPDDLSALAQAGFRVVIDNRPDTEIGPEQSSARMADAAAAAGLDFHYIPFIPGQLTPQIVQQFAEALASEGPALAYCRSGTRSATLWALSQAGQRPADEILRTAADAGYDLGNVAPLLTRG